MDRKNTINEIANQLNLSRNTVSKVLSGKPGVSAKTKKLVEGYLDMEDNNIVSESTMQSPSFQNNTILFSYRLENVEYINGLLAGIEKSLKDNGYLLALNIVQDAANAPIQLPDSICNGSVCGIISFNIYDYNYWQKVIALNIPSVFFDTLYKRHLFAGKTDIITQENQGVIRQIIEILKNRGRSNFGYFGDPYYCLSLHERWRAYKDTLSEFALPFVPDNCILDDFSNMTDLESIQIIKNHLLSVPALPDAYICASDRQAILLLGALNELSINVPKDVAVVGFDNLPEALRQSPPLTTIEAYSKFQGELAVKKILERLTNPTKPHEFIHCESTLILRESTGHFSQTP